MYVLLFFEYRIYFKMKLLISVLDSTFHNTCFDNWLVGRQNTAAKWRTLMHQRRKIVSPCHELLISFYLLRIFSRRQKFFWSWKVLRKSSTLSFVNLFLRFATSEKLHDNFQWKLTNRLSVRKMKGGVFIIDVAQLKIVDILRNELLKCFQRGIFA